MKKLIFLFVIVSLLSYSTSNAQSDLSPVVYSITGKVKYAPGPDAKFKRLRGGADLAPEGMLRIHPGATLGLYYDEEYAVLTEAGELKVSDLINDVDRFQESDLAELFGKMIDEAINPYFQVRTGFALAGDPPPPPPSKGTKDGHGNKEFQIIRLHPTGGKVSGNKIPFHWKLGTPGKRGKKFIFTLKSARDQVLLKKPVKGFDYELTREDYRLENGQRYTWQVSAQGDPDVSTPNIFFEYAAPAALTNLQNSLRGSRMYQTASPVARLLIEASVLEQADFLTEAYDRYREAAKKGKKNELAQLLFEAFQWRYDMIE